MNVECKNKQAMLLLEKYLVDGDQIAASELVQMCQPKINAKASEAAAMCTAEGVPGLFDEFQGEMYVRLAKMIQSYDLGKCTEFFVRVESVLNNAISDVYNKSEFSYRKNVTLEMDVNSDEEDCGYYYDCYDVCPCVVGVAHNKIHDINEVADTSNFEDEVIERMMSESRRDLVDYVYESSDAKCKPIVAVISNYVKPVRNVDESNRNSGTHGVFGEAPLTDYEWVVNENGIKEVLQMKCNKTVGRRIKKVRELLNVKLRKDIEKRFGNVNDYLPRLGYERKNA